MQFDQTDNTFNFKTVQDATPILDDNKARYNAYGDKLSLGKRGEWHHAASIPITIWEKWQRSRWSGSDAATGSRRIRTSLNHQTLRGQI